MTSIDFTPAGVCSRNIHVELDDAGKTIERIEFAGGCNGNLKAISALVAGHDIDEVTPLLEGITCGQRSTSCADQLTRALRSARELATQEA